MDIIKTSDFIEQCLKDRGIEKAVWEIAETETRELNADAGGFTLYRTLYGSSLWLSVIINGRKGTVSGTELSRDAVSAAVESAAESASAAPEDAANGIAPCGGNRVFRNGDYEPDEAGFFARTEQLLDTIKKEHPLVMPAQFAAEHKKTHCYFASSTGSRYESFNGLYSLTMGIAGNDGTKTTGLDETRICCTDLSKPFMECGTIAAHIHSAEEQLHTIELKDKFRGTVILTPDCLGQMLGFLMESCVSERVLLDGTGLWNGRTGEKVCDEKLTFGLMHSHPGIAAGRDYTREGFVTQDLTIVERGVLKNRQLSLYTANRTGGIPSKNDGLELAAEGGNTTLQEMIGAVDRGLLVGGFSGGEPGTNGEFSGVARNSFLIEKGKIKGAVCNTVLSGNLMDMFSDIAAVSSEVYADGICALPYMAFNGVVISGS